MVYFTFPWEQIGTLLRKLSLSAAAGNVAAWIVFVMLGSSPLVLWGVLLKKKKAGRADCLLALLALVMFPALWFFINPGYLEKTMFPAGLGNMGKAAFALTLDSILLAWLLLRFLENYEKTEKRKILRSLQILLGVYIILLAGVTAFQGCSELSQAFQTLRDGNSASGIPGSEWMVSGFLQSSNAGRSLMPSYIFLILQKICACLPEILELALFAMVIALLHCCETDGFSVQSLEWVKRLKIFSARFLVIILCAHVAVNLLQLLFAKYIYNTQFVLRFPIKEIIVVLGILMLSRFYLDSRKLKEDNELFI